MAEAAVRCDAVALRAPRLLLVLAGTACVVSSVLSCSGAAGAGGEDLAREFDPASVARGELLLEELQCIACHAAPPSTAPRLRARSAPDLAEVGARTTPAGLRRWLAAPHAAKPGTPMPDLLASLDGVEREEALDALVHHLASRGGPLAPEPLALDGGAFERGRRLYHAVGCVACHAPLEPALALADASRRADFDGEDAPGTNGTLLAEGAPATPSPSVPLGDLAGSTTPRALAAFLRDPLRARPSGRMPSLGLTEGEASDLAHYLIAKPVLDAGRVGAAPGLLYDYFEDAFDEDAPDFAKRAAARTGIAPDFGELPEHREDGFGFRFHGWLDVPAEGLWRFETESDDGSRLLVDGQLVVRNDGHHPMQRARGEVRLDAGPHAIEVTFFEGAGQQGLRVRWEGPSVAMEPIPARRLSHRTIEAPRAEPFAVDASKAARGGVLLASLGCVACHPRGAEPAGDPNRGPALADLDPREGCLDATGSTSAPRFALTDADRAALRGAIRAHASGDAFAAHVEPHVAPQLAPRDALARELDRFRCGACHERDGAGGPAPDRRGYFQADAKAELGDEGRFPPRLDGIGAKLRRAWLEEVLVEGAVVRPTMRTRMPRFGRANVGHLPALLADADGAPPEEREAHFDLEAIEAGRRLVGTKGGLGCIQCHGFAGVESLGMNTVDLAGVTERLSRAWFTKLLADPASVNLLTRMPVYWVNGRSPVKDLYDGDPSRQIDAMWTYLALGRSAPLPKGLQVSGAEYELEPIEEPILCGVFMEGVSPRTLLVGYPERTHVAFDVESSRLAKVWRGRFFDARGTWHGRAGKLERPPGDDVLDLAPGAPLAILGRAEAEWPAGSGRDAGLRPRGRTWDELRRPVFQYRLGETLITELAVPMLRPDGSWIARTFVLRAQERVAGLWHRAAVGRDIVRVEESTGRAAFRVDGRATFRVLGPSAAEARVVATAAGAELRVPVAFERSPYGGPDHDLWVASLQLEFTW